MSDGQSAGWCGAQGRHSDTTNTRTLLDKPEIPTRDSDASSYLDGLAQELDESRETGMFRNEGLQFVHGGSDARVALSERFTCGGTMSSVSGILHVIAETVEQRGFEWFSEYISNHEMC